MMVADMLKLDSNQNARKYENERQQELNGRLVHLQEVVKTYQSSAGIFTALKGVDLQVESGAFVSIIGKSGSGKSTLINVITGIDHPTSGEVIVDHAVCGHPRHVRIVGVRASVHPDHPAVRSLCGEGHGDCREERDEKQTSKHKEVSLKG